MIPVSNGHALRALTVERKTISVNVIVSTLCGQTGIIEGLAFQFFYPEMGEQSALEQAIGCGSCAQIIKSAPVARAATEAALPTITNPKSNIE